MNLSNKGLSQLPSLTEKVENFNCGFNNLTNLKGSQNEINGYFNCSYNHLTDLIGAPNYIGNFFNCENNQLTSLVGVPKIIKGYFSFTNNLDLLDISDIWESDIDGIIFFDVNRRMALLPLSKFNKLSSSHNNRVVSIHERNRGSSKQNILDFQYDLIENGFAEHARWKP